jgi:hypothetical protein
LSQDWVFANLSGTKANRDQVFGLDFLDKLDKI